MKTTLNNYFNPEESERFAEWAFGVDHKKLRNPLEYASAWNDQHINKYRIRKDGTISEDLKEMIMIYKTTLKK